MIKGKWNCIRVCVLYSKIQEEAVDTTSCGQDNLDGIYKLLFSVQVKLQKFIPKHLYKCICFREQLTSCSSAPQLLCYSCCSNEDDLSKNELEKKYIATKKKMFSLKKICLSLWHFSVIELKNKMSRKFWVYWGLHFTYIYIFFFSMTYCKRKYFSSVVQFSIEGRFL